MFGLKPCKWLCASTYMGIKHEPFPNHDMSYSLCANSRSFHLCHSWLYQPVSCCIYEHQDMLVTWSVSLVYGTLFGWACTMGLGLHRTVDRLVQHQVAHPTFLWCAIINMAMMVFQVFCFPTSIFNWLSIETWQHPLFFLLLLFMEYTTVLSQAIPASFHLDVSRDHVIHGLHSRSQYRPKQG
jgi:hypothetical protein